MKEILAAIVVLLCLIVVLLIGNFAALIQLHRSTECHITSMTTQVCDYR